MQSLIIDIVITRDEYLTQYRVPYAVVVTHSRCGRSVKFPASILQRFVTHSGIRGSFKIFFNQQGKFSHIEKI